MSGISLQDWLNEKLKDPAFRAEYERQAPMHERIKKRYRRCNTLRWRQKRARKRYMRA